MSLKTLTLMDQTLLSTSAGSELVFAPTGGTNISNGIQLVIPGDENYQERRSLIAKVRQYTIDPKTGEAGKDKKSVSYVYPQILTSGRIVFNTIRIEREVHPSFNADNCAHMLSIGAQLCFDSDMANFWAYGDLS